VNYKSRIESMVDSGVLTKEQAQSMQGAIGEMQSDAVNIAPATKRLPTEVIGWVGAVILLFLFIAGMFASSGSVEPEVIQNVSETLNTVGEVGKMSSAKQSMLVGIAVIGVPLLICILSVMFIYNGLITKEENVLISWAQVESNLQRRADLIPNLVTSIKTYMAHEKDVLDEVSGNRAGGLSEVVSALEDLSRNDSLNTLPGEVKEKLADETFMKALALEQEKIGQNVNKLMGVVEAYPELRSSDQFMALQSQLEGTENRINVTRMVFNEDVGAYNASIRKIPGSFIAGMGNFKRKAYFQADEGSAENKGLGF